MRETCLMGAAALRNNTAANTCPFLAFPCPVLAINHPGGAWVTPEPLQYSYPLSAAQDTASGKSHLFGDLCYHSATSLTPGTRRD